jgi:UDP-N-acetylmuramoyl-L-alanyl-D-glutamate--2,6-diaminopimelate ligase
MVSDIQIDSRKVGKGSVFVAIKGEQSDGHKFFDKAIELGAVAIVCETLPKQFADGITYIQ